MKHDFKVKYPEKIAERYLESFSLFLAEKMGLHFPKERWNDLQKKMHSITQAFGFEDDVTCITWLMNNPITQEQISILAYYLTIGETYFFRDSRVFELLENKILPEIIEHHQTDQTLRIWSAGCCTGEEPYSIAILLYKLISNIEEWNIQLMGTDINAEFLNKAQKGAYKKWSFRATPAKIIHRYFFDNHDGTYSLIPEIKKLVTFGYFNLASPKLEEVKQKYQNMDLILCNNVLIYFSQKQIDNTVRLFSDALAPGGWLNVASIEIPFIVNDTLTYHNFTHGGLFKKEFANAKLSIKNHSSQKDIYKSSRFQPLQAIDPQQSVLQVILPAFLNLEKSVLDFNFSSDVSNPIKSDSQNIEHFNLHHKEKAKLSYQECLKLFHEKKYQTLENELLEILTPIFSQSTELAIQRKYLILLIKAFANQGKLTQAMDWCNKALTMDKLDPMIYYLQGIIYHAQKKMKEAIQSLKQALFLDSHFIAAYHMLGMIEIELGNKQASIRNLKATLNLIKGLKSDETIPGAESLTVGTLKQLTLNMLEKV